MYFQRYGYGQYNDRRSEPDYMDVKKPHFSLDHSHAGSGRNILSELKQAKKDVQLIDTDDVVIDTQLAPGLLTDAKFGTSSETRDIVSTQPVDINVCIECSGASDFMCEQCQDAFCLICFKTNHRSGKRQLHKQHPIVRETSNEAQVDDTVMSDASFKETQPKSRSLGERVSSLFSSILPKSPQSATDSLGSADALGEWWSGKQLDRDWFVERSKYIPLRLTHEERRYLRLLEGVLKASSYTDKVDMKQFKSKATRTMRSLQEIVAVLQALVASTDMDRGRELMSSGDLAQYASFFQHIFEIGRRHKIRNPQKMQSTYGTLLYLLQDTQSSDALELLGFSCVIPIYTVHTLLAERDGLDLLRDPRLAIATQEIVSAGKTRDEIDRISKRKKQAMDELLKEYKSSQLTTETLKLAIYSIGDNHSYLRSNRDPCSEMINLLTHYFRPNAYKGTLDCLSISDGTDGARLTHSHATQYHYVLQSLCLWRDILDDFFKLWYVAESDLLSTKDHPYTLTETGQGVHRLQHAPLTDRILREIVFRVQHKAGNWVGSAVIHLGDRNVPNALMFIDKYNQVGKILAPLTLVLRQLGPLAKGTGDENPRPEAVLFFKQQYEGKLTHAKMAILQDFFKYAFDGSGSDNFFEAGSCIDGRLTSAWHWCNELSNKSYYPLFQMTGFSGFDGQEWD